MNLGGAETLIMNLYRNIDRSMVQFDFLLHGPEESAYEKEILALGGRIFRIPRYLGYNRKAYEKNLTDFLMAHPEFTIVHDHLMDSAAETLKVVKKLGRIAVAHSHTSSVFSLPDLYRFFFRKDLWKIADYRFACSEAAGKWLYRNKADFMVLRNGINTEKFRFSEEIRTSKRHEFAISDSIKLYGTVGRLDKGKNQIRLLGIMRQILALQPDSKLMIVGNGPLEARIRDAARKMDMEDKVILTGPRTDVNELLCAMDSFVFTSINEGLGIVLVEAQASGLPCIFTDTIPTEVDLNPELIHRVSLSESDATWAKIAISCTSSGNRATAYKIVAEKGYDIKTSAEQIQKFYLRLMEKE